MAILRPSEFDAKLFEIQTVHRIDLLGLPVRLVEVGRSSFKPRRSLKRLESFQLEARHRPSQTEHVQQSDRSQF